jgi:HSP20 family protein
MSLTKWDPFRELDEMSQRLNHLFGRGALSQRGQESMMLPDWQPSVDISETPEAFLITAELPDVKKEDIKVSIENDVLTLRGERKQEKEENGKRFHRIERSYGTFMRSFALPDNVDGSTVKADVKDGILEVQLAKTAREKPKTVEVKVG